MKNIILSISLILLCGFFSQAGEPLIGEKEAKKIALYLDDICGDTYCAGDWAFANPSLNCDAKACQLITYASPYWGDYLEYTLKEFQQMEESKKKGNGWKITDAFHYDAFRYPDVEFQTIRFEITCDLDLPENIASLPSYEKSEVVYNETIECTADAVNALTALP